MKVAINKCHGGFGLSAKAEDLYAEKKGWTLYRYVQTAYRHEHGVEEYTRTENTVDTARLFFTFTKDHGEKLEGWPRDEDSGYWFSSEVKRDDPVLIEVIEELGTTDASGFCAELEVVEIPDDIGWHVQEYDGLEWIAEEHRTWP